MSASSTLPWAYGKNGAYWLLCHKWISKFPILQLQYDFSYLQLSTESVGKLNSSG